MKRIRVLRVNTYDEEQAKKKIHLVLNFKLNYQTSPV